MMRKRKNASVCLALVVILTCYLWQTIDCYRLRKTERRDGRTDDNTPNSAALQEGRIVFRRVFERGSGFEASNGTQKSSDVSSEDEAAYQADFTGWYNRGQMQDRSSGEASWRRMSPSLQCGGNQMKFRAMGPGASQFAVEQGHAPPLPLSQVPPSCGYTMQKNPLSLVMSVPYDGCNMQQEGGNHVLPMRWQGIPVSLMCPGAGAAPNHPPSHHQMPPSQPANRNPYVSDPHGPQYPSYPHHPPQYPSMPEPTKAPTTKMNAKKPGMPQFPVYPPYFPYYPSFPLPMTTAKPTTSAPTTTAKPAMPTQPPKFPYPYFPPYYPPFPWAYPGPKPTTAAPTTASTTTTKQTTTQTTTKPTAKPQPPRFPPYFPYPPFYPYPPFFPPLYPPYQPPPTLKPQTTTKPTTATPTTTTTTATTTTTTKKTDPPRPPPHFHPHAHYPFPWGFPPLMYPPAMPRRPM